MRTAHRYAAAALFRATSLSSFLLEPSGMSGFSTMASTAREVAAEVSEKNVTFMAAGIAYNAFVSLAPLVLLLLFVASFVGGGLEARLVSLTHRSFPRPIAEAVARIFDDSASAGASLVGLVVVVWGTLKLFRGLDTAFSEIFETEGKNSFVDQLVDGVVVLVALVVAIVATVGASAAFATFADSVPYLGYVVPLLLVVGMMLAFLPMYYRFPDTDVDWNHVLPGVAFSAVGWAALQGLFQVYLVLKGNGSESFFGGVVVIVTWLYFSGIVLLIGAVITAVLAGDATGAPGGVGRGATSYETEREESMSRGEFADHLEALRAELTGRYEKPRSTLETERNDRYPQPAGDIEVVERSSSGENGEEWTVQFTWRAAPAEPAEEADERPE